MAKKYIDAELLKKEIESLKSLEYPCDNSEQNFGFEYALDRLSDSLNSLQQEQEKESLSSLIAEAQNVVRRLTDMHLLYKSLPEDIRYKHTEGEWRKILEVIASYKQQEQPCDTCTNDKGCVTCKDGELWEGVQEGE